MNLVVDQGNTYCKLAIFDNEEIIFQDRMLNKDIASITEIVGNFKIAKSIVSSVSNVNILLSLLEKAHLKPILLTKDCKMPIKIAYKTPETLGIDRIIAAVGAWKLSPNTNNLIIDIGTAITYDIATPTDGYIGGNIAPGLDMRLAAMNHFTQKLPLLERSETENIFGQNTNEAIRNGAQLGITAEIEYHIKQAMLQCQSISVFLTGGDAYYFEKKIKNSIFAIQNLLLVGLHEILKLN